jgi:hypothetical protein
MKKSKIKSNEIGHKNKQKKDEQIRTSLKKELVLKYLIDCYGMVTNACAKAKIAKSTFYEWINSDSSFMQKVNDLKPQHHENFNDLVQDAAIKIIKKGGIKAQSLIIHALKTKAKDRGFGDNKLDVKVENVVDKNDLKEKLKELSIDKLKEISANIDDNLEILI